MGGLAQTYRVVPPSTVVGFIEAFLGREAGTFARAENKLAVGEIAKPTGRGILFRTGHIKDSSGTIKRPVNHETWFNLRYRVVVQGPWEKDLRDAFNGDCEDANNAYGVLCLGESEDLVNSVVLDDETPARWLVPGKSFMLPIQAPYGYSNLNPILKRFSLSGLCSEVPEEAFFSVPLRAT